MERSAALVVNGQNLEGFAGDSVDDNVGEAGESDFPLERVTAAVLAGRGPGVGPLRRAFSRCS